MASVGEWDGCLRMLSFVFEAAGNLLPDSFPASTGNYPYVSFSYPYLTKNYPYVSFAYATRRSSGGLTPPLQSAGKARQLPSGRVGAARTGTAGRCFRICLMLLSETFLSLHGSKMIPVFDENCFSFILCCSVEVRSAVYT